VGDINCRDLIWAISSKTKFPSTEEKNRIISGLRWLGLFSDTHVSARGNALDTLCATLEEKMQYALGERDMCILQHKFIIEDKDGKRVENPFDSIC
jgi:saccharopine dehydrogenase (NADP+, L-glutamate forming)